MKPKPLRISTFRRHAHALLEDLPAEGVVITKRGRPVARLTPLESTPVDNRRFIGALKNKLIIWGDILSTGDKWEAES